MAHKATVTLILLEQNFDYSRAIFWKGFNCQKWSHTRVISTVSIQFPFLGNSDIIPTFKVSWSILYIPVLPRSFSLGSPFPPSLSLLPSLFKDKPWGQQNQPPFAQREEFHCATQLDFRKAHGGNRLWPLLSSPGRGTRLFHSDFQQLL